MTVDTALPAFNTELVVPKLDSNAESPRDQGRKRKSKRSSGPEARDPSPELFLNALGQLTGGIVNTTA